MRSVIFSADERIVEAARRRARAEHTTLNDEFLGWLSEYACRGETLNRYDETISVLRGKLRAGRKLSRDEMNTRSMAFYVD